MALDASTTGSDALCATLDLARRVDRAEIEFCALAGDVGSTHGVERLEAGGGLALYSKPGSPLNKVLGLGLGQTVSDQDLDRIEAFYAERRIPAQIELCPLAASDVAARLIARGFVLQAFENELARRIGPRITFGLSQTADVRVTQARPDQDDLWMRVTAEGFAAFEPPVSGGAGPEVPSLEAMMEMMSQFAHPKIRRYLAWVGNEAAGGGAGWIYNGIVAVVGTSTLPQFRRRGVQRSIAIGAMEDAAGEADLAIATTAPGSTSQRTFERLGFRVLYTRAILVKAHS